MLLHRTVTSLTTDAWRQAVRLDPAPVQRVRGMAIEALAGVFLAHDSPGGFFQIRWRISRSANREIERSDGLEEADAAFVPIVFPLVDICLAGGAESKSPRDGHTENFLPVSHRVGATFAV